MDIRDELILKMYKMLTDYANKRYKHSSIWAEEWQKIDSLKERIKKEKITDADIEAWIDKRFARVSKHGMGKSVGAFIGAKAMRDGEIKRTNNQ